MTFPNYLHIGYSKAASTWLQEFLRIQKDIFLVYKSYFFFPLESGIYQKGMQYYSEFFKDAAGKKVVIESHEHIILPFHHPELKCASTNLEVVEKIARRIKKHLPEVKIIITIRNQVDILLSRYTQYIIQGGTQDASTFLNKLVLDSDNYLKYMDYRYSKVIKKFYEIFGESNVLVLFQEVLRSKPEEFLKSLSSFLNYKFSYSPGVLKKGKNVSPSYRGIKLLRLINRVLVKEVETIESKPTTRGPYFIWYFFTRVVRVLDHWLIKSKKKRKLFSKGEIERIKELFAEDNKNLSKLLNLSLFEYGYYYDDPLKQKSSNKYKEKKMPAPTFKEINVIIESVPGEVCSGTQPEFLYELSYGTKGIGEIVEIGTNVGKTAIALAYGQKVKKGKPVYSIDIYEHPDIKKNLEKAGVTDYVNRIIMPSHKMAKKWEKPIELLWIDGDHSYKGVCYDIKNWVHFVVGGGVIAFHDYPGHRRSKEVWKALRKYLFKKPYTYRVISDREAGSIIAFRKITAKPPGKNTARRFKGSMYWMYRNIRSIIVRYFPGLAKRIKDFIKE